MIAIEKYADLIREIDLIKEQIKMTKHELKEWCGIDVDKGEGTPLSGKFERFGVNTVLIQTEDKLSFLSKLEKRLKELEYAKVRQDMILEKLEGIDYKIGYKRIVENKTHKEIAIELGYEEQTIRKRWSRIMSQRINRHY